MRKEVKIPWSALATHAKWGGLGLLLAIAGAVGCVNFSLTQPQTKPLTPVAKRPKLPAYAAANLKKTPARGTRQVAENMSRRSAQPPAVASRTARPTTAPVTPSSPALATRRPQSTDPRVAAARTAARPNPYANQRVNPFAKVQPKPAQKAPQALATAFDARKNPGVVQAGASASPANPSRILRIGGTPVADPFLNISTSADDQPAAVPEPPPEAVPQPSRQPSFTPAEGEDSAPGISPPEQSDEMPPLPIERADADERVNRAPAIEQTSDEGPRDRYEDPNRALPPKYPPPKANSTAQRNRYFRLPRRNTATNVPNRHRFSENLDHDQPPAPREFSPQPLAPPTAQKPRATPRRERQPIDYETLDSGELLRPLDPEIAQLPRLGENSNTDTPQVELLDSPPGERDQVAEADPNNLIGRRRAGAGNEPLNSQMAESFADAAEAHPLPPGPGAGPSYDQASRVTPWSQQRGVPARTVSRQRHSRFTGSEETPPTITSNKRVALPIIRPAQRNGLTPVPVVTPRRDESKPATALQPPAGPLSSEPAEGSPRDVLESPQAQFPPPAASSAVRLDGIVIEDDDTAVAPTAHRGQVRLAPPDIMESSPNTVPPPPKSITPPPSVDSTLPPLPASTAANGSKGAVNTAGAPIVPLEPANLDLSLEDNSASDSNGQKRSIIGKTSLIGLGVGLTGLLGLLMWRYLDRRSHRQRRLNLSLLKAAEAKLPVAQEAPLKIAEPAAADPATAEPETPRLHRAA